MKKVTLIALLSLNVFAADYTAMTMEELQAMRGSVAAEDKAAFQTEMQSRMQALSPEERQAATSSMRKANQVRRMVREAKCAKEEVLWDQARAAVAVNNSAAADEENTMLSSLRRTLIQFMEEAEARMEFWAHTLF